MALELDAARYPRLSTYIKSLPGGIDAYSESLTTADFSLRLRVHATPYLSEPTLPEALRTRLSADWKGGSWIPAVTSVCLSMLVRDRLWPRDDDYNKFAFEAASETFRQPLYRALMFVMSPTLVIMGAGKRWRSFHQNSDLQVLKQTKYNAVMKLTFAPRIFPRAWLMTSGVSITAGVACAGGTNPSVHLDDVTETSAQFTIAWS